MKPATDIISEYYTEYNNSEEQFLISKEEFGLWKQDLVTKKLMDVLEEEIEAIEGSMLNDNVILKENAAIVLANLAGLREGLRFVRNISIEDIYNDDTED